MNDVVAAVVVLVVVAAVECCMLLGAVARPKPNTTQTHKHTNSTAEGCVRAEVASTLCNRSYFLTSLLPRSPLTGAQRFTCSTLLLMCL